ncbi:hypothetical protein HYT54_01380 [Candidatus Woesearchaeota archaeon]|nr:hypothetical protein [Candidatus Woesearchaeota archaeon]
MDIHNLAKKLEGLQTVSTIGKTLGISRRTSINYISKLRKNGFAETSYGHNKVRMYKISPAKLIKSGNDGLIETLNKNSKVKLILPYSHRVYGHKIAVEKALVEAVKSRHFRTVLASLGLFAKIKNWHLLHELAVKENAGRKIGALYDAARQVIRVRRMDKRTRNALLKSKTPSRFIIDNFKSEDLVEIQKTWGVYVPFNRADLEVYKE